MVTHISYRIIYDNPDFISGQFKLLSDTKIIYKEDNLRVVFKGDFTYDVGNNPSGQVDTISTYYKWYESPLINTSEGVATDISDLLVAALADGDVTGLKAMNALAFDGDDVLTATYEGYLRGYTGDDMLYGGTGTCYLAGGDGNDTLYVGAGGGENFGGAGRDTIYGNTRGDYIFGGDGNDRLVGGDETDDPLISAGNDELTGGNGNDLFIFISETAGIQTVKDFTQGEDLLFFANYGLTTLASILEFAVDVNNNTVFDFGENGQVIAENVLSASFAITDFGLGADNDIPHW